VSRHTKHFIREYLVGEVLRTIDDLFRAEGFEPVDHTLDIQGERRNSVEQFYAGIDWNSSEHVRRFLKVLDELARRMKSEGRENSRNELLERLTADGFDVDDRGNLRSATDLELSASALDLKDYSAVQVHFVRMRGAYADDPEAAIGHAKDLLESALKYALEECGVSLKGDETVPVLAKQAQKELGLHPESVAPTVQGFDSVTKVLGNLSSLAVGLAELRNLYGIGHGRQRKVSGIQERHGLLAVNAAIAYVDFLLSTLNDASAPWRNKL
jgi:hypothetical protein